MQGSNLLYLKQRNLVQCTSSVMVPTLATLTVSLVAWIMFHNSVPHSVDKQEWLNFTSSLVQHTDQRFTMKRMTILSLFHLSQIWFGVPFLLITKILYGYWFGLVGGLLSCLLVEFIVVMPVLLYSKPLETNECLRDIIKDMRDTGQFRANLFLFQICSLSLFIRIAVVVHGGVTRREFLISYWACTLLFTTMAVLLGTLIYHSLQHILLLSLIVTILTALPTVVTMYLIHQMVSEVNLWLSEEEPGIFQIEDSEL